MKLQDKVALVTGASSGIGRAVALAYAKEGALVAASGRNAERLAETQEAIATSGGVCSVFEGDVTQMTAIDDVVNAVVKRYGRIDILFNGAGIAEFMPFLEVNESLYDSVMDTNLKGQFFMSQKVANEMKLSGGGRIVCMASVAGPELGAPNLVAYCASKAGVAGMIRAMALELAPFNIGINGIAGGHILSPMNESKFADPLYKEACLANLPIKRIGSTADVTPAAVYLASSDSSYMTGRYLIVDGGASL